MAKIILILLWYAKIDKTYCFSCGSVMERDDDGDRYYYMCTNMDCKSWNGEDVI